MTNLGNLLLYCTAISCIFSITFSFSKSKSHKIKIHTLLQFGFLSIALLKLINLHINTDYRFANVIENSHELIPIMYKITGVWANHEGSMLLLAWSFSMLSFVFSNKSKFNESITDLALSMQSVVILCLLSIIFTTSNPFTLSEELLPVGHGFNPLLQDVALTIHPPILYLGYAGLSIPATISIAVLLQKKLTINNDLLSKFHIWIAAPWALLSCGIALGSWWAYRELGWGGFWFWDPVENVSLIVWIASTISLHMLKLSKTSHTLYGSFFISHVSAFILSFFGMLLVRSGMLVSVHSFAFDPEKGQVILAILLFFIISSTYIFIKKWKQIIDGEKLELSDITTSSLIANIVLLACACLTIILGIMYPVLKDFLYNKTVSVDEEFYTKTLSIFFLPIIYISGIYSSNRKIHTLFLLILSAFIVGAIHYKSEISSCLNAAYMHASIFLILSLLRNCANNTKTRMTLGHLGFAVLVIGGALHYTYQFSDVITAQKNKTMQVKNYSITFRKIEYSKIDNYLSRKVHVEVADENKVLGTIYPEIRFYPIEKTFTIESAILHTIKGDIYLTLGELDKEKVVIEVQFKPFMYLLWIGGALMVMSIILYFSPKHGHTKIENKD